MIFLLECYNFGPRKSAILNDILKIFNFVQRNGMLEGQKSNLTHACLVTFGLVHSPYFFCLNLIFHLLDWYLAKSETQTHPSIISTNLEFCQVLTRPNTSKKTNKNDQVKLVNTFWKTK